MSNKFVILTTHHRHKRSEFTNRRKNLQLKYEERNALMAHSVIKKIVTLEVRKT
jgi:hypothetical protein